MDGNGRWAKKRGLPRTAGHTAGASEFPHHHAVLQSSIGVQYLDALRVFHGELESPRRGGLGADAAFSSSTWRRRCGDFMDENIRVRFIGDASAFAPDLQALIERGGGSEQREDRHGAEPRHELRRPRRDHPRGTRFAQERVKNGAAFARGHHGGDAFRRYLYTAGQPDPDLIIRPSGEERISNFLAVAERLYRA